MTNDLSLAARQPSGASVGCVVVGTSAGGLAAIRELLSGMPRDYPLPLLIVQHLSKEHPSRLAQLLAIGSPFPVAEAVDDTTLKPGHAYICPANRHLEVGKDGQMRLTQAIAVRFSRPSVDVLFDSAAEQCGAAAIAVILTGMGHDGTRGAQRIKEAGGRVVCSDEASSQFFSMPRSARDAGFVDEVLPLKEIAGWLVHATANAGAYDDEV